MPLYFCSVSCWDSHLSMVRHRDAYAVEAKAPSKEAWAEQQANAPAEPTRAPAQTPDRPPAGSTTPMRATGTSTSTPTPSISAHRPMASGSQAVATPSAPMRRVVGDGSSPPAVTSTVPDSNVQLSDVTDKDMLIVISKMKKYIKDRSGMNCSDAVADMLSDHVRLICDEAIRAAGRDERKTVLDRDVPRARR
jgi:histone H3/H4